MMSTEPRDRNWDVQTLCDNTKTVDAYLVPSTKKDQDWDILLVEWQKDADFYDFEATYLSLSKKITESFHEGLCTLTTPPSFVDQAAMLGKLIQEYTSDYTLGHLKLGLKIDDVIELQIREWHEAESDRSTRAAERAEIAAPTGTYCPSTECPFKLSKTHRAKKLFSLSKTGSGSGS